MKLRLLFLPLFVVACASGSSSGEQQAASGAAVTASDRLHATQLFAHGYGTCAILDDGDVRCWGQNSSGESGYVGQPGGRGASGPIPVATVHGRVLLGAGSVDTTCGLVEAPAGSLGATLSPPGTAPRQPLGGVNEVALYCWGNTYLHLPRTSDGVPAGAMKGEAERVAIEGLAKTTPDGVASAVRAMAMSPNGDLCLATESGVVCVEDRRAAPVDALAGETITRLALGTLHKCAASDAAVWCWGANADGRLGDGTETDASAPVKVVGLTGTITALAASNDSTCAATTDGVYCWGNGGWGQLGDGATTRSNPRPVKVSGLGRTTKLVGGQDDFCALADGAVSCWGFSNGGEQVIGEGAARPQLVPLRVAGLEAGVTDLAAGQTHVCALSPAGVECWGSNLEGELGGSDPETAGSAKPLFVLGAARN